MFTKILIANRGEIAVRVIRACKELGIMTVAVFSEADRESLHVQMADESYCIGKAPAKDSYLNMQSVIAVALAAKADAIHPGYGFLSENHAFASLCQENDIVFIGPQADLIYKMGDKDMARRTMVGVGFPVIPGSDLLKDLKDAKTQAVAIGFPLLIKARAGGGGRGIYRVDNIAELEKAYHAAIAEATSVFGDDGLYLEKLLVSVKHIELQILADHFGNVVCLGERDCSAQRKNQKVIEESPGATVPQGVREAMFKAAIEATKAVGYQNAGTIECLYDQDSGHFYFMEMNTRIQVEHTVTEAITAIDLIKWQIWIAEGMKLNFTQEEIHNNAHAIECRINAENPYDSFKPSYGEITKFMTPQGPFIRLDTGVHQGATVSPFYDSMIGKLIVSARTRGECINKMLSALSEFKIEGIHHNIEFLKTLLLQEEFLSGEYTTSFIPNLFAKEAEAATKSTGTTCIDCSQEVEIDSHNVCPHCGFHFKFSARKRIALVCDSFVERDKDLATTNPLDFPDYDLKLEKSRMASGEKEAVITGIGQIHGMEVAMFAMEPDFMMGSMGSVVGEKITRIFEIATKRNIPVIGFIVSGGARMQEGMVSLMQMVKTSGAVKLHSNAGLLYMCMLTNPTTGGVTASFAMEADIILAEPKALIGFAGPRIIEQVTRSQLPAGFQRAEFLLEKGFVDQIVPRKDQKTYMAQILQLHGGRAIS